MTLAEFLLARIAEDEEDLENSRIGDSPEWWMPDMWNRERAEAECEAKRRIVEEHRQGIFTDVSLDIKDEQVCIICHYVRLTHDADGDVEDGTWVQTSFPCPTLKFLAIPYASHPDYREEWL